MAPLLGDPPRWRYFKAEPAEFDREYICQLDRLGPAKIARALEAIATEAKADSLVLLCFEASGAPEDCHRGLWARWWLATGELVREIE
jgi:hypothetical protein